MGITQKIAKYVAEFDQSDVTDAARTKVRHQLLDSLGIACIAAASPFGDKIRAYLDADGAEGSSSVVGSARTYSVGAATYANAAYIHAIDFDDMGGAGGHPAVSMVSASLATAEELNLTAEEYITGYIAGYEASTAIQRMIRFDKPLHGTAVIGPLGAALACARLRQLSVEQTVAALSIAATESIGIRQSFGSELKPLQVANGARIGAVAALLASKGFQGDDEVLEGPEGFAVCFAANPQLINDADKELEGPLKITETPSRNRAGSWVVAKPWPCCGSTHDGLTAFFRATKDMSLNKGDIVGVRLDVPHVAHGVAHHSNIRTGLDGKFSLRYVLTAAARDGEVVPSAFSDEEAKRILASDLYEQMSINSIPTDDPNVPGMVNDQGRWLGARVTVTLKDGTELVGNSSGDSDGLVSDADMANKFNKCATALLSADETSSLLSSVSSMDKQVMRDVVAEIRKDAI